MKRFGVVSGMLWLLAASGFPSAASANNDPPAWISQGPYVEETTLAIDLPLEVLATKMFVDVEVGGAPRRFVFDTGSPSMMSAELASELKLDVIDRRQGRDAHGAVVDTDIVQADFRLGGITFHKVPVFVADFPATARCLFDGVLGSEVLPLCAWQIDLPDSVLRCRTDLAALDHVSKTDKVSLHDFGYPHAPIFDIKLGKKATSKAMFDTGSPEYLAISKPDYEGARRGGGIGKTLSGYGSIGGSLGGRAPESVQLLIEMKALAIGDIELGRVGASLRASAPSLIGASILDHFVVTLDTRSKSAYLDRYQEASFARATFGLNLDFEKTTAVALVWEGSPAAKAGLSVGQLLTSINGRPVDSSCDGIRHAMRALSESDSIELEWSEGATVLTRESVILD